MLWLFAHIAFGGCDLTGDPAARFAVPVQGEGRVSLVIEIWPHGAAENWAPALLDTLEARSLPAMVVVPAAPPDASSMVALTRARAASHGVAVVFGAGVVPKDKSEGAKELRKLAAPVRKIAGKVNTAVAPIGPRNGEAMLGRAGFHNLVDPNANSTAEPRMAGHLEGQPRVNVVLPPGPYDASCGADPRVGPLTPAAADRAGVALQRAARTRGTPVVRVALLGSRGSPDDAAVLARWLDEVVLPGGIVVRTANQARMVTLKGYRNPASVAAPVAGGGGKLVPIDSVEAVALALADITVLPRTLPGNLNPTEAFHALLLVGSGNTEGAVVRLGALRGPATLATSSLTSAVELRPEAVRILAKQLVVAMPTEVPGAISVEGHLLTASELLLVLGGLVRGDDPIQAREVAVPDPNARGLGWGDATLP